MTSSDEVGTAPVLKPTGWLTNSPCIAERPGVRCSNLYGESTHRHVHLVNGRARAAQVYPVKLCLAILNGLRDQLTEDRLMYGTGIGSVCCEEPIFPEDIAGNGWSDTDTGHESECHGEAVYYDDISGAPLPDGVVQEAIKGEMAQ